MDCQTTTSSSYMSSRMDSSTPRSRTISRGLQACKSRTRVATSMDYSNRCMGLHPELTRSQRRETPGPYHLGHVVHLDAL